MDSLNDTSMLEEGIDRFLEQEEKLSNLTPENTRTTRTIVAAISFRVEKLLEDENFEKVEIELKTVLEVSEKIRLEATLALTTEEIEPPNKLTIKKEAIKHTHKVLDK